MGNGATCALNLFALEFGQGIGMFELACMYMHVLHVPHMHIYIYE